MAQMHLVKLIVIFLGILALLWLKRPLWQAMTAGVLATALLYRIAPLVCLRLVWNVLSSWGSMSILAVLYLTSYLQRMLEARGQIRMASQDLNGIFHNRRVNASVAPMFIGLLPSAAAMLLCGDIVRDASDGYLDKKDQAFMASWFRHMPESTLPTYSGVLLMTRLSGLPVKPFMLCMIVPLLCLAALGYVACLRRLPRDPGTPRSEHRWRDALHLLEHLWTLLAILALILVFGLPVTLSIAAVIALAVFVYRFPAKALAPMLRDAFEARLLLNSFLVLVLREFIADTGILHALPELFSALPIPMYLVFALLFFVGGVVSGTNGIIALGAPMAFAAVSGAGVPLMVLLMCMCHAASQISPTHVCLTVAAENFGISLGALVRRTLPATLIFCALMVGWYNVMLLLGL